ncbi:hypothetical protein niasHT_016909 [Heterodera trifolii]|uniref:Uncharacterized protein n=1 Tax=Heterodera trifolii TaxID=157864 RepID=A0ABD2KTE6_9BILA
MVYSPIPKKCYPASSYYGSHNVFIDSESDLPCHFYGGCWNFPYSNYPLNALYKSSWLNRPYHNMGNATDWYR